jgi:hypothetical protein
MRSRLVPDELILDGNARQTLATSCQTWEQPKVPGPIAPAASGGFLALFCAPGVAPRTGEMMGQNG